VSDDIINELANDFTGRDWLFEAIEKWLLRSSTHSMLITGDPGAGKSAVAAQLVRISGQQVSSPASASSLIDCVSAYHFCHDRDDVTLNPLRFVKHLSTQLASKYPEFAAKLATQSDSQARVIINARQEVDTVGGNAVVQNVVINQIEFGAFTSARDAFDNLIRLPLQQLYESAQLRGPLLIVVDSLDEALTYDRDIENTIVGVLRHSRPLPPNVFFLLTSRRTSRIDPALRESSIDLILDAPDNTADVEGYCLARFEKLLIANSAAVAKRIAQASNGNFLYAKFVVDDLLRRATLPQNIDEIELPTGLYEIFQRFIERDLITDITNWQKLYRRLLGYLAVARGRGLSRDQLLSLTGLSDSLLDDALVTCLPYLRGNPPSGPFELYHLSFREYLLTNPEHSVYPAEANFTTATWLYDANRGHWGDCGDEYAIRHTVRHLSEAVRTNSDPEQVGYLEKALVDLATDFEYIQTKIDRLGVDDLVTDLEDVADALPFENSARPDVMAVERVIHRERHNLRLAGSPDKPLSLQPSLLRQVQYRATSLGLTELALRAEEAENPKPLARLKTTALTGTEDPALIRVLAGHSDVVMGVGVSVDGELAFSGDGSGLVKLWNVSTGRSLWSSKRTPTDDMEGLLTTTISKDGRFGLSGYHDGTIAIWTLATGDIAYEFHERESPVLALSVNETGTRALAGFEDKSATYLDLETRRSLLTITGSAAIATVCLNDAGDFAIIGDRDGIVTAFDFAAGRQRYRHHLHRQQVQSVAFSKDESSVISCGQDGVVLIFSSTTGVISAEVPREGDEWLYRARLTHDGALAVTCAEDNKLRLWDIENKRLVYRFNGHSGAVVGLDLCGPSSIISCGGDHNVILWDLERAQVLYRASAFVLSRGSPSHDNWVRSISVAADASIAASGAFDKKIVLWRLETGEYVDTIGLLPGGVRSVSLSSNGDRLLALCHGRFSSVASVWNVPERRAVCKPGALVDLSRTEGINLTGWAGVIGADGQYAVSATQDLTLSLWDIPTGLVRATYTGHRGTIYCAAFGPNDETLLSGSDDSRAILWDTRTAAILRDFQGHTAAVWSVAMSQDGSLAATGSQDSTARVWDTATGKLVAVLEGHTAPVMGVQFCGDGRFLVTGSEDKSLILWDVRAGSAIDRLFLDAKVSCVAGIQNLAMIGDYGGALSFFRIEIQ